MTAVNTLMSLLMILIGYYESGLDPTPARPGLVVVPRARSNLISFKPSENGSWTPLVEKLNTFIEPYEEPSPDTNLGNCGFDRPVPKELVCWVDLKHIGSSCTAENGYGYPQGQPCVMLYLEKVIDWAPVPYNSITDLPSDMPENLKSVFTRSRHGARVIWVSCDGESAADRENIGPIHFRPDEGFPMFYFPFTSTPAHLSPIIALQFFRPKKNVEINVECRAWAKNLVFDRLERSGSVHFKLLVD